MRELSAEATEEDMEGIEKTREFLAYELINIRQQIDELVEKQAKCKAAILPLLKNTGAVKLSLGMVYYGSSDGARTFRRADVLAFLVETFGEAVANATDAECTNTSAPRETVYVKLNAPEHFAREAA